LSSPTPLRLAALIILSGRLDIRVRTPSLAVPACYRSNFGQSRRKL
jgi:hypothetical protein